jgi:hypothetical protein
MVNPGHASKGCVNCKARRIKCDEALPSCQRCSVGGRTCLGYRSYGRRIVGDAQGKPRSMSVSLFDLNFLRPAGQSLDIVKLTSVSAQLTTPSALDTDKLEAGPNDGLEESSATRRQTPSQCILDTVATCFDGLWDPFQSRETRRLMLQSYQNALHMLRVALLSDPHDHALVTPTRSLAFYEVCCFASCRPYSLADQYSQMAVSSDWEDNTWRTHLDAYFAMLRQTSQAATDNSRDSSLLQALQFVYDNNKRELSLNDPSKTDTETAELLLDVCKLRLSNIAQDLAGLFERGPQPRKLDIQKLRLSVKRLYADVLSVSKLISPSESRPSKLLLIEHSAVKILAASLLIEFGEYLHPAEALHNTLEYAGLTSSISLASVAIRKSVSDLLSATRIIGRVRLNESRGEKLHMPSIADAVSVMWPLTVVLAARNQEQTMQDWAGQMLYRVGQEARVPKALHLVRSLAILFLFP